MGRYQLGDRTWEIDQRDAALAITDDGRYEVVTFPSAADAKRKYTILVNQRARAGWRLVTDEEPSVLAKAPLIRDARNPELELAVVADPYDVDAWRIYGDWLQQQGDPRGDYIAERAVRIARGQELRTLREPYPFIPPGVHDAVIGWGFIDEISLLRTPIEALARPEARFVTKVIVRASDESIAMLAEHAPPTLREITARGRGTVTDLSPLTPRFPLLHKLDLCTELAPNAIILLARAPLDRLVELALGGHNDVRPVLARDLPALERLYLEYSNTACATLVKSPLAPRLRELELMHLQDRGAKELLHHVDRFERLGRLGYAYSKVSRSNLLALHAAFGVVETGKMRHPFRALP
ncbi:MAG: hypothetical protein ABJE66_11105 [Deltaproteobacteria bacterium]